MFAINTDFMLLFMFFQACDCQRRITGGRPVEANKRYVVYLVKAPIAKMDYAYWMCGGAIVSAQFVVTSAACVKDVDYLFVIAGYNKYVPDYEIQNDPCTKVKAKKVIYTCSPKGYQLKYNELDYWSYIDIAMVKVETPFLFNDIFYTQSCSYNPSIIPINYDEKYYKYGSDVMVLGWGHKHSWRKPGDTKNYNSPVLKYAATMIFNKTECINHFDEYVNMSRVIEEYMVCTLGEGNIDDKGSTIMPPQDLMNGCTQEQMKVLGFEGVSCEVNDDTDTDDYKFGDLVRRNLKQTNMDSKVNANETEDEYDYVYYKEYNTRRQGICQNDHGGPLITWVGSRDVLIGVASVFKVSEDSRCTEPFLYTSTAKVSKFLECVLTTGELPESGKPKPPSRRDICDSSPEERGFDTIERYLSWKDYPEYSGAGKRHHKKHKHYVADEDYAKHEAFSDQKHIEHKKIPVFERHKSDKRIEENNIVNNNNQAKNTEHGRNLYKKKPKIFQPVKQDVAMRPLLPLRN